MDDNFGDSHLHISFVYILGGSAKRKLERARWAREAEVLHIVVFGIGVMLIQPSFLRAAVRR